MVLSVSYLLQQGAAQLEEISKSPRLDAELLLMDLLKTDRMGLFMAKFDEVSVDVVGQYQELIAKRATGIPLQYLRSIQEFMGLSFYVKEGVLVPRPDTEILVETLVERLAGRRVQILDIGVGSGAIAISLDHYIKEATVTGVDISPIALEVARYNNERLGTQVYFYQSDLFSEVEGTFDVIASNPPYIPREVIPSLSAEVAKYEPKLALDGGLDGLDYYRLICKEAVGYLNEAGVLALEIGHDQGPAVQGLMEKHGFTNIEILKDLSGHNRVVIGTRGEGNV